MTFGRLSARTVPSDAGGETEHGNEHPHDRCRSTAWTFEVSPSSTPGR